MAKVAVRPYLPEDYLALLPALPVLFSPPSECAQMYAQHPSFSGEVAGQVAACAGLVIYWPGVAEAWAVLGPVGRENGYGVTRAVMRGLVTLVRRHRLHRVQAKVIPAFEVGRRWVEWMGFQEEAYLRDYGPNREDMLSYVLFPKETA